ncbi:cytochrome P450 [Phyllosticta capitalensis]|uniref:cytochrome P450 n=1 Tax=Phyllosticta capitalensis TaxID=121624 RepID=UPI00312F0614
MPFNNKLRDVLSELGLRHVLGALLVYLVLATIWLSYLRQPRCPKHLPHVGHDPHGWLSPFCGFRKRTQWIAEGYEKYSKRNRTFIIPCTPGSPNELVLPRSQLTWLVSQPDSVISTAAAHYKHLDGDYAFHDRSVLGDAYHEHVVHKSLLRNVNAMLPDLWDEIGIILDEKLGDEPAAWRDVNIFDILFQFFPRITSMVFVGRPLCRDHEYLKGTSGFAIGVAMCMWVKSFTPAALRPIVAPLAALPNWINWRRTAKFTLPVVKQRLADMERKRREPDWEWQPPNDFWTWFIRTAVDEGKPQYLDPVRMTRRLMPLSFASIHTSSLTGLGVVLDLAGSDPKKGYLEGIREEAARVLREHGNLCSKEALAKLYRADSAVRESIRLSNFAELLVHKLVVAPEGITNEAEGWHAPKGTFLCMPIGCVHHDEDIYDSPWEYDAFRFSREREEYEARSDDEKKVEDSLKFKQGSIVTTGDSYMTFGHGKHACPGRFLVAHVLKMMLAYMVLNYDIEPLRPRPANKWMGMVMVPPLKTLVRFRRREKQGV